MIRRLVIASALVVVTVGAVVPSAAGTSLRGAAGPSLAPSAAGTPMTVTPHTGTPSTRFKVRFRNPYRTIRGGVLRAWEVASVSDRAGTGRCTSQMSLRLAPAPAGRTVRFTLAPGGLWCAGRYSGTVTLFQETICPGPPTRASQDTLCPEIEPAPILVGRFSFRVRRPAV